MLLNGELTSRSLGEVFTGAQLLMDTTDRTIPNEAELNAKIKARCLKRIAKEIEDPEKQTEAWSRVVERAEKYGRKGTLPAPNGRMLWRVIEEVKYPKDPDALAAGSLQAELREKELAGYGSELDAAKWSIQQAKNRLQWVKQYGLNKCGEIEKLEVEAFTSETTEKLSEIQKSIDTFLAERLARKDFSEGYPG
jgi:predicted ATP-dependent protease